MGDLLAQESLRPGSAVPRGNRSDRGSPWGLYRSAGVDQWVAICCRSNDEWRALVDLAGLEQRSDLPLGARIDSADDIDASIRAWTETITKERAAEMCLAAGVPAGPDQRPVLPSGAGIEAAADIDASINAWSETITKGHAAEMGLPAGVPAGPMLTAVGQISDPHLRARGYLVAIDQPPIGGLVLEGAAFHATGMVGPDIRPAPGLGEHTRDIAAGLLGLSDAEIDALVAEGVLETDSTADTE